jgi:hypothetical protein
METNVERRAMGADAGIAPIGMLDVDVPIDTREAIALMRDRRLDAEPLRVAAGLEVAPATRTVTRPKSKPRVPHVREALAVAGTARTIAATKAARMSFLMARTLSVEWD